jgi:hypothetical protein
MGDRFLFWQRDRSFTDPHQQNLTRPGSLTPERKGDRLKAAALLANTSQRFRY